MRNLVKLGLLTVTFLATITVTASNKLSVKVASSSKMLSISLTEVASGETLYIKDFQGEILFSEKLDKSPEYTKVFSLSDLPSGVYFIESKEESKVQVTPVILKGGTVSLVEKAAKTYLAPEITVKEGAMEVKVRNYNNTDVSISIYDQTGALLNKKDNNSNTLVIGSYDISNLESQTILVSVTEGDYHFAKEIKL